MVTRKSNLAEKLEERPQLMRRVFEAPREAVWKAWTEPERIKQWWGPKGYTTPFATVELRRGGEFRFCMRSPEGKDFWGKGVYSEIRAPERLVYADSFTNEKGQSVPSADYGMPDWPNETLVTVTFGEDRGKTVLTLESSIPQALADQSGAQQGWSEMFDRLASYLARRK